MTKWSDPLQIFTTCVMEVLLRLLLRIGFLVCVRPGSVSSFLEISHLDPRHDFERSLLQLALLHQADWAGAVPESAPGPNFTLLQEQIR